MKKLLSLLLAAGMLVSAYAPTAYALPDSAVPSVALQDAATPENAQPEPAPSDTPVADPAPEVTTSTVEISGPNQAPAYLAAAPQAKVSPRAGSGLEERLSFRVTAEDGMDITSNDPFADMPFIVGKSYTFYPLLDGKPLSDAGYTLVAADIYNLSSAYLRVDSFDSASGSFVLTPISASSDTLPLGSLHLALQAADGTQENLFIDCIGQTQANTGRLSFTCDGSPVSTLTATAEQKTFVLSVSGMDLNPDTMEITYSSSVQESVTITPDDTVFGTVTLTVNRPVTSGSTFSATVKDKTSGQILNTASVSLEWYEPIEADTLPDGSTIYFGTKTSDHYDRFYSSDYSQIISTDGQPSTITSTLSVFFGKMADDTTLVYANLPEAYPEASITVESLSDTLTISNITPPAGDTPFTFTYALRVDECTTAQMRATVTVNGQSYTALFTFHVNESIATDTVTVSSSAELTAALRGVSLLPGGTILLESGIYEGDFEAAIPVMITGAQYNGSLPLYDEDTGAILEDATAPAIKGSITATSADVALRGLRFEATDTSNAVAVTDANVVSGCTFTGYDTALVLAESVHSSANLRVQKNAFVDNNVALSLAGTEWMSMIQDNSFLNNGTAIRLESRCYVSNTHSNVYDTAINQGKWSSNFFRGTNGQTVFDDQRNMKDSSLQFNYNYYAYDGTVGAQDALFAENSIHSVFYTTPALTSVSTDVSLTALAGQGGLDLVAQQQNTTTADTALNVSGDLFDKLQKDTAADNLTLNVWTADERLAAVWDFPQAELTDSAADQDVNLGVRDTLDADEQAVVDANLPNGTDRQSIHFMHDGVLPGTATVEVPLTATGLNSDDLALYYINEDTDKLEPVDTQVTITDGMLSFDIEHCSSYIVAPKQKELTVTWPSSATFTYDGSEKTFVPTLTGVADGDTVEPVYAKGSATSATKAGNYTVTLTGVNNAGYVLADNAQTTASWTIEKAAATDDMKKASGSMEIGAAGSVELNLPEGAVCGTPVYEGNLLQDLAVKDGKLTFTASDELVYGTTCTVTVPVTASDNYLAYDVTVTLTTPERGTPQLSAQPLDRTYNGKAVTADEIPGKTAVYNGQAVAGSWTLEGTAPKDAGSFTVTLRFTPDDTQRYADATLTATGTIAPCPVTVGVQPSGSNRVNQGAPLPTLSLSVTGLPENETLAVEDAAFDGMPANAETVGDYTITVHQATRKALEALPQAGNYAITYVDLTLTILPAETVVLPATDPDYRVEKEPLQGISGNSALNTPEKVQSAMMQVLSTQLEEVSSQNTQLYDVTLYIRTSGTNVWKEAAPENFPTGGYSVTLPYPAGLKDAASYHYTVLHMCHDGTIEQPVATNTETGIQITVHSLSPIAVSWAAVKQEESQTTGSASSTVTATPTPAPGGNTVYYVCTACGYHNWTATEDGYRCDHCGHLESVKQLSGYGNVKGVYEPKTGSTPASGAAASSVVPATSDESHPMVWVVLLIVAGVAFVGLLIYKKRKK